MRQIKIYSVTVFDRVSGKVAREFTFDSTTLRLGQTPVAKGHAVAALLCNLDRHTTVTVNEKPKSN